MQRARRQKWAAARALVEWFYARQAQGPISILSHARVCVARQSVMRVWLGPGSGFWA